MSELVFPQLPGLAWGTQKTPVWSSRVQRSVSGKRQAIGYMSYPIYRYSVNFNVLRAYANGNELATLQGFFNQMRGQVDTFKFVDPNDANVVTQPLANGNGVTTDFQLVRTYGGFTEPVQTPNVITTLRKNNGTTVTSPSGYTLLSNGIVRYAVAPLNGQANDWTGTFYWRCAFTQDTIDLINGDGVDVWKSSKISFETIKL